MRPHRQQTIKSVKRPNKLKKFIWKQVGNTIVKTRSTIEYPTSLRLISNFIYFFPHKIQKYYIFCPCKGTLFIGAPARQTVDMV